MAARRARIDEIASALLDRRIGSGTLEVLDDLIRPLAGIATLELLGLPIDELAKFAYPVHSASHDLRQADGLRKVWDGLKSELAVEISRRAGEPPRDDLIDAVRSLEVAGRPASQEFAVDTVFIILIGGVKPSPVSSPGPSTTSTRTRSTGDVSPRTRACWIPPSTSTSGTSRPPRRTLGRPSRISRSTAGGSREVIAST